MLTCSHPEKNKAMNLIGIHTIEALFEMPAVKAAGFGCRTFPTVQMKSLTRP